MSLSHGWQVFVVGTWIALEMGVIGFWADKKDRRF